MDSGRIPHEVDGIPQPAEISVEVDVLEIQKESKTSITFGKHLTRPLGHPACFCFYFEAGETCVRVGGGQARFCLKGFPSCTTLTEFGRLCS